VQPEPAEGQRPICVDLDGTLVATDTLWESMLLLLRNRPLDLFMLPVWLMAGRAAFKRRISDRVRPAAASLPYREPVVAFIEDARSRGCAVHLVTAADQRIADAVAEHLGVFDGVFGSDGARNLKGHSKAAFLEEEFGPGKFDYLGDASGDVSIWKMAGRAFIVNGSPATVARARGAGDLVEVVKRPRGRAWALLRTLRPHQWMKNSLLFIPIIVGHHYTDLAVVLDVFISFFAFSLCASAVYVLNDLLDLESDRKHRSKRNRPLASGLVSIPTGIVLGAASLAVGLGLAFAFLPLAFVGVLAGYLALTTIYTLYLKQKLLVDVITLALLFTYRVLAGGVAASVPVSFWLLVFSLFFFTGLAFVKRYSELTALNEKQLDWVPGRNYGVADLEVVRTMGTSCGIAAVLVMCLYINSPDVHALYERSEILYLVAPVLLYWIGRVWFLAARNQLDDDPVVFAIRDRISLFAGLVMMGLIAVARFWS
jgi:4-hydroxybenzoate polyprenyltransferase